MLALLGLEALAPYYKALAAFSILQIMIEGGIPAQYQRHKSTSVDLSHYLHCNRILMRRALFFATLTAFGISTLYILVESWMLLFGGILIMPLKAKNALILARLAKHHQHPDIVLINTAGPLLSVVIPLIVLASGRSADDYLNSMAIAGFFVAPTLGRFAAAYVLQRRTSDLRVPKRTYQTKHKKITSIRRADVFKSILGTGNTHLAVLFSSLILSDNDIALLGLLVSWGRSAILLVISSLKQITYPIIVDQKSSVAASRRRLRQNYFVNLIYSSVVIIIFAAIPTELINVEKDVVLIYLIMASIYLSSTPWQDWLKAKGYFNLILYGSVIKFFVVNLFYISLYFSESQVDLELFVVCLTLAALISHFIDIFYAQKTGLSFWGRKI